jgi:NAD(P)-dependent dehydrogenase (short-subunit alcohol dehydrogenase family)
MAKSHHDKVAVISGAASGIGQAFAQRLAQDGAHIIIADVLPAADTVRGTTTLPSLPGKH